MVNEFYNTYNEAEFKELAQWRQDYITTGSIGSKSSSDIELV